MGNKEDLLAAARACIYERGFAGTTARDIATRAGVSLAAIGYHFGSKDRLLTEAFTDETGRVIGDELERRIRAGAGQPPGAAFPGVWDGIAELFAANRDVLVASAESLVRVHHMRDEQTHMGDMTAVAVADIAETLRQTHPGLGAPEAHAVAELYFIILNGMVMRWLSDPRSALPTGAELARAIAALATDT